jgi:RHS repeat-associated protein
MHPLTDTEVYQETHYYPFGMTMEGEWQNIVNGPENNYLYNGKELNSDFGLDWSDYGARYYDAAIGRWNSVDLLTEKHYDLTPYNYVMNNPIFYLDPLGMDTVPHSENLASNYEWSSQSEPEIESIGIEDFQNDPNSIFFGHDSDREPLPPSVTDMTVRGTVATPVGGLTLSIGLVTDSEGSLGLIGSGGIAVGFDASLGFELSISEAIDENADFNMTDLNGQGKSTNVGAFIFDKSIEGGNSPTPNILDSSGKTYNTSSGGISVSPNPVGVSRLTEGTGVLRLYKGSN